MSASSVTTNSLKRNTLKLKEFRRGAHNTMNTENYSLYFWDLLHSNALFASLNKINDYVNLLR